MPLFRVTSDALVPVKQTTFGAERLQERRDLQRLLKNNIAAIDEDLLVLAEEFGDFEGSSRRIDLLCVDRDANLVVVELKRTEDGGHMELQAIRYAAMVSSMTFKQAVKAHADFLGGPDREDEARAAIESHLGEKWPERTADRVRIVLCAADFSSEVTTTVLWLNRRGLRITCLRVQPHRIDADVILQIDQIIPLPEAADYEIRVREQAEEQEMALTERESILQRFWRQTVARSANRTPNLLATRTGTTGASMNINSGRSGIVFGLTLTEGTARAELYSFGDEQRTKRVFNALYAQKDAIEEAFGSSLEWHELPGKRRCRIFASVQHGWGTAESEWPKLQDELLDRLERLHRALHGRVQALQLKSD
jgi:hypothetical protein